MFFALRIILLLCQLGAPFGSIGRKDQKQKDFQLAHCKDNAKGESEAIIGRRKKGGGERESFSER